MQHPLFNRIDPILSALLALAVGIGLILLISAEHGGLSLASKQIIRALPALLAIYVITKLSKRDLQDLTMAAFLGSVALLIFVLLLGYMTKGAQRWLDLGFFKFEPSELLKITLPLALAHVISRQGIPIYGRALLQCLILVLVPFWLVLKQPDLGTALTIATIGGVALFLSGISRYWLIAATSLLLIGSPILWHQLHDYQKQRIMTLVNPESDLKHHGYHIHQSKIAIGSGGVTGAGFIKGNQVQHGFLPEHRTDFIFGLLCEEFGFIGSLLWMLLVCAIGFRCIMLGDMQHCMFSKIACICIGCNFMINAWINMAMVSGMIPVVGIPLPLVSYGGTNYVMTLIGFGLVLKLGHINPKKQGAW